MATPAKLQEMGLDGFALIEKYYGAPRWANIVGAFAAPARNGQMEDQGIVICSNEAASHYGGIMVLNYPKGIPQNGWGRSIKP